MDKFYEAYYDFMNAQKATGESITALEDVIGCIDGDTGIFASYNRAPVFLENICFPGGTDDYTSNNFHRDYWNVVNGDKSIREFYDTYFKKGS